ncbi:DUF6516 family protein [Geminocystis sp.]|uniref:toxin-antitoxin system TumE family protein n=1 Tax=Geminocystis sp. TaxID=2664100 RepID=UPI003593F558
MLIEVYSQYIIDLILEFLLIKSYEINLEKRATYEGFIKGKIIFIDQSYLHIREFVDVETNIDRKMYSYQYMNPDNNLIFRYDNTEHHQKLNLPNFPHHKHEESEKNVINSNAPFLKDVIKEITAIISTKFI